MNIQSYDESGLAKIIYNQFLDAWDNEFYHSIKPKNIQKVIHAHTRVIIYPCNQELNNQQRLDQFYDSHKLFLDIVYHGSPRGSDLTLAWCPPTYPDERPAVQAITIIHPFQVREYNERADAEIADHLKLWIGHIEQGNRRNRMERWENVAESVLGSVGAGDIDECVRFYSTRNTVLWQGDHRKSLKTFPVFS